MYIGSGLEGDREEFEVVFAGEGGGTGLVIVIVSGDFRGTGSRAFFRLSPLRIAITIAIASVQPFGQNILYLIL